MQKAVDESTDSCCPLPQPSYVGLIVGVVLGALIGIFLIALLLYCLICKKPPNNQL